MKILITGSGGREHILSWKINQSPTVEKVYCAPGNAGTALIGENVLIDAEDIDSLINSFAPSLLLKDLNFPVAMLCLAMNSLANILLPSILAAALVGPKIFNPFSCKPAL